MNYKYVLSMFFGLMLLSSAFAIKPVTWNFYDQAGNPLSNVITQVYTCSDANCYFPTSTSPYFSTVTSNNVLTNANNGWSAFYFFADGYFFKEYMGFVADTNPYAIDLYFDQGTNCHAVIDNLNVPYEVENNKPVTINVPISANANVNSPFGIVDAAPYYMPVTNNPSDPLFNHLAADTSVTLQLINPSGVVVHTETKNVKVFADTEKTVSFTFNSPANAGMYSIRVVTDVTDNQCASSSQDETTKGLKVVDNDPDCYTLINNLETSIPYPMVNQPFEIGAHVFGHVQSGADNVAVTLTVSDHVTGALVNTETQTIPTDVARDLTFSWTPTVIGDYDIVMTTNINNALCSADDFEFANIIGFYVKPVPTYKINFHISDNDGNLVNGASIALVDSNNVNYPVVTTDANGLATISGLYEGDYKYTLTKNGYQTFAKQLFHVARDTDEHVIMTKIPPLKYSLGVNVKNGLTNSALNGALVQLNGPESVSLTTDANGNANFASIETGTYNIVVSKSGFESYDDLVFLDMAKTVSISLQDINDAPVFNAVADKEVNEIQNIQFTISATDSDELVGLTYSVLQMPEGATFNPSTKTFSYTPDVDSADPTTGYSRYEARFKVEDTRGASDELTVKMKVNNVLRTFAVTSTKVDNVQMQDNQNVVLTVLDTFNNKPVSNAVVVYNDGSFSSTQNTDANGQVIFNYAVSSVGAKTASYSVSKVDFNTYSNSINYNVILRTMTGTLTCNANVTAGSNQNCAVHVVDATTGVTVPSAQIAFVDGAYSTTMVSPISGSVGTSYLVSGDGVHSPKATVTKTNYNTLILTASYSVESMPMTVSIDCLPNVVVDSKQACTVNVKDAKTNANLVGASVHLVDGSYSKTSTTNAVGNVVFEYAVTKEGSRSAMALVTNTNYADATAIFYYNALAHAYNIDYFRVYGDNTYSAEKYTFYRGENLYAKFQVVDKNNNNVIPASEIVTSVTLVSLDGGGRVDLVKDQYTAGYYYYMLEPIPLTHEFIGKSGLYALAINFTDNKGGEGTQYITILNNAPTISTPNVFDVTKFNQFFDLSGYLLDAEGDALDWNIALNEANSDLAAVVSKDSASSVLANPQRIGSTEYLITAKDSDNEISTKVVTFNVANYAQNIAISESHSDSSIWINRTAMTFTPIVNDYGIFSNYDLADYTRGYAWTIVNDVDSSFVFTSNAESFSFVPQVKAIYTVMLTSTFCDGANCIVVDAVPFEFGAGTILPPKPPVTEIEKIELYIGEINLEGGTTYYPGDDIVLGLKMENNADEINFDDLKIVIAIPELHVNREAGPFDLKKGKTMYKSIVVPIPEDSDAGEYTLNIDVMNNAEVNRRVGRFIEILPLE